MTARAVCVLGTMFSETNGSLVLAEAVTVKVAVAVTTPPPGLLATAVITAVPWLTAVTMPPLAVMLATDGLLEAQVTELVRFCVVPSLKVPVAVNCSVFPMAIEGFAGVTAMDANVAGVTVSVVLPETEPEVA